MYLAFERLDDTKKAMCRPKADIKEQRLALITADHVAQYNHYLALQRQQEERQEQQQRQQINRSQIGELDDDKDEERAQRKFNRRGAIIIARKEEIENLNRQLSEIDLEDNENDSESLSSSSSHSSSMSRRKGIKIDCQKQLDVIAQQVCDFDEDDVVESYDELYVTFAPYRRKSFGTFSSVPII